MRLCLAERCATPNRFHGVLTCGVTSLSGHDPHANRKDQRPLYMVVDKHGCL